MHDICALVNSGFVRMLHGINSVSFLRTNVFSGDCD